MGFFQIYPGQMAGFGGIQAWVVGILELPRA